MLILTLTACRRAPLPDKSHTFVGEAVCAKCHGGPLGNQVHEHWQGTAHARAWRDLAGERARVVAREMGVAGDPQTAASCLVCHSTGQDAPEALRLAMPAAEGVSCEACHGPGGDYAKKLVMPETREAHRHGLRPDPQASCPMCHEAEVAHLKPFDYKARWPLVAHALPKKP